MKKRLGFTLVEVLIAIAILGIMSIGFISIFSSQMRVITQGSEITVGAFDNQGRFEEKIYDAKTKIQAGDSLSSIPEWSQETVSAFGESVTMEKLSYQNPDRNNRETTIYLSSSLAEVEERTLLSIDNVYIDIDNVNDDPNDQIADLMSSPAPQLIAAYDDNSSQSGFYANLFRWYKTDPGVDPNTLSFPDDYYVIPVSQQIETLDDLVNTIGSNRYVLLEVTPVDINGFRGSSSVSSNRVYVKGPEWRVGVVPWVDMDENANLDGSDYQLAKESVQTELDARDPYPNPANPSEDFDLSDGSLYVPMMVDPASTLEPGNEAITVTGTQEINWLIERDVNLAKDFSVENGSIISIVAGLGTEGGSIHLHPYAELDASDDPITVDGVTQIIDSGVTLDTTADIEMETMGRGGIQFHKHAELNARDIILKARGVISINHARLQSGRNVILDNTINTSIPGPRDMMVVETDFLSTNPDAEIQLKSPGTVLFRGGSWSADQTLLVPNGKSILFDDGDQRVNNMGVLDVADTGEIRFADSMLENLSSQLRLRVLKSSDTSMQLETYKYLRNTDYADAQSDFVFGSHNTWYDLGRNRSNFEVKAEILSGDGMIDDIKYSFDGTDTIQLEANTTDERGVTQMKLTFRDQYASNQITGEGTFQYMIDSDGNPTIVVDEESSLDTYRIVFDSKGGTPVSPIEKIYGDPVTQPPAPVRPGYTFSAWSPSLPPYMPNFDLNVEAIWTPNEYTVTLHGEGGEPSEQTMDVTFGQTYGTLPTPTLSGHAFDGWYTTPTLGGDRITAGDIYAVVGDQDLYARWSANELTVTFDSNGGTTPSPGTKLVTFGETYGDLPEVTRENYDFSGWFTSLSESGELVTEASTVNIATNHSLYAKWSGLFEPLELMDLNDQGRNEFTLTFNNEISGIVDSNLGFLDRSGNQVTFNRTSGDQDIGDYVITVIDDYDQELTVELELIRYRFLGFLWYVYEWELS